MKTSKWLCAALALSLAPALARAQDRSTDTDTGPSQGTAPKPASGELPKAGHDDEGKAAEGSKYTLWKLHQANQMEIQMSELALTHATSKETKGYAQKMIADHKGADAKVTQAASKAGADLDQKPSAADKAEMDEAMSKMDEMKSTKGAAFDSQFMKQMADDHKKVVEMATAASRDPAQKDIKPLLTQLLPKLQQHEAMAMRLANAHGSMPAKAGPRGTKRKMDADSDKDMDYSQPK